MPARMQILGSNYLPALEKWIPLENIPVFLGGRSAGTLLDDLGPWSDTDLVNSIGLDVEDLRHGKSTTGGHMLTIPAFGRTSSDENASGYLTPSGSITSAARCGCNVHVWLPDCYVLWGLLPAHTAPCSTLALGACMHA